MLGFIQRFEYLVSHHMKKAHTAFNVEYIIGGIGSMFRRSMLDEVGLYDTNTMTEDIDLTMKIIAQRATEPAGGVRRRRPVYTEAVPSFGRCVRQRYRWKYGRAAGVLQALAAVLLAGPQALAGPVVVHAARGGVPGGDGDSGAGDVATIFVIGFIYRSPATILSAIVLMSLFGILNVVGIRS